MAIPNKGEGDAVFAENGTKRVEVITRMEGKGRVEDTPKQK
jgi:hypothetical protein